MAPKAPKRIWAYTRDDRTDWDSWKWIGAFGGGYSFLYKPSDMDRGPQWIRKIIYQMDEDWEGTAASDVYYVINGKVYSYGIVPVFVETGNAKVDVLRRKRFRNTKKTPVPEQSWWMKLRNLAK